MYLDYKGNSKVGADVKLNTKSVGRILPSTNI